MGDAGKKRIRLRIKHETKETLTLLFSVVSKAKNPSKLKCVYVQAEGRRVYCSSILGEQRNMFLFNK